jgi:adenylate kinase
MNLIILGPQGSGKGTQAKLIAQKYGLTHISTGELFRNEINSGSELGKEIAAVTNSGELVSDEILFSILEKADFGDKGFILDGTPRNLPQAEALNRIFEKTNLKLDKVILVDLPYQISIDRMLNRAKVENRADDNLETIKKRLDIYHKETVPVVDYYRSQGKILEVDGRPDIDTIFQEISQKLG